MRSTPVTKRSALVVLTMLLLLVPLAQPATAADSTREQQFVELMNAERTARGKKALAINTQVVSVARGWSDVMARESRMYHNPRLGDQITEPWTRAGENVGNGYSVDSLHKAFMNSPGHRANVLGDYDQVGIGVTMDGRRVWVTFNFIKAPRTRNTTSATLGSYWRFKDVAPVTTHGPNVNAIADHGVTKGCASLEYCPDQKVTRAEMASFLARALDLAPKKTYPFNDVTGGTHAGNIAAIAAAGITNGCGSGNYCPDQKVTRAAMASFLARALDL